MLFWLRLYCSTHNMMSLRGSSDKYPLHCYIIIMIITVESERTYKTSILAL